MIGLNYSILHLNILIDIITVYKSSAVSNENKKEQNQAQMSQCTSCFMFNKYLIGIRTKKDNR